MFKLIVFAEPLMKDLILFFLIIASHDGFVYSLVATLIKWNILRFTGLIQKHQPSSVLNQIILICCYYWYTSLYETTVGQFNFYSLESSHFIRGGIAEWPDTPHGMFPESAGFIHAGKSPKKMFAGAGRPGQGFQLSHSKQTNQLATVWRFPLVPGVMCCNL